jgi:hypothetical protein
VGHALNLHPQRQRFLTPDGRTLSFPTDGTLFTLGTDPQCAVRWQREQVQPQHAEGQWREGQLWVRDRHTGTTLIDGARVPSDCWTPVRDGGHLQFGGIEEPALTLGVLSGDPETFPLSDQPLLVTYFGDTSVPDIASLVRRQPARFEKAIEKSGAPVHVSGLSAAGGVTGDLVHCALPVVLGTMAAAGLATAATAGAKALSGGPLSLPLLLLGGALTALGGFGAHLSLPGARQHWGALQQKRDSSQAPVWESKSVSHQVVGNGPRASQFEQLWHKNLSQWPNSRHVVYLSGHGLQRSAAGLSFDDLGQSVRGAEAIVLDVCNGGQLESLSKLTHSARVAVVSEHTVRGYGFPLESMFGQTAFAADSRDFATALVRSAARGRPAQSLVGVDLQALDQKLLPSLDRLGRSLIRLSQAGQQETLRRCLDRSETTDADDYQSVVDLGSFLAQLEKEPALVASCPELARTTEAFNQTVVAMIGHGTLSFDRRPATHLPEGWRQFLRDHRK